MSAETLIPIAFSDDGKGLGTTEFKQLRPLQRWARPPPLFVDDLSPHAWDLSKLQAGDIPLCETTRETVRDAYLTWSHHFFVDAEYKSTFTENPRGQAEAIASRPQDEIVYRSSGIRSFDDGLGLQREKLQEAINVSGSVLFGTADEPHNWGLWVLKCLPAAVHYIRNRDRYSKFFCYANAPSMLALLRMLGITDDELILHRPLSSYHFEEVTFFRQSWRDLSIPMQLLPIYRFLGETAARIAPSPHRNIYVARARISQHNNMMRGLLNEGELIEVLAAKGFHCINPEEMSVVDQMSAFNSAHNIVGLGGAGMFNTVFCTPRAYVIDIESTGHFVNSHASIFGSITPQYAIIVGNERRDIDAPRHRPWDVDVGAIIDRVTHFMPGWYND